MTSANTTAAAVTSLAGELRNLLNRCDASDHEGIGAVSTVTVRRIAKQAASLLDQIPSAQVESVRAPTIGEFWVGQGGVYAGIARGAPGQPDHHLIVASAGGFATPSLAWGGEGLEVAAANCEWDGLANTRALLAAPTDHPTASACASLTIDGHSDFYLPARRELALCYATVASLFESTYHWSSTQCSRHYAWFQGFSTGFQDLYVKGYEAHVRAVRRLPLRSISPSPIRSAP